MFKKVDRTLTNAAFVDSVVYYSKILALNAVIKDEEKALAAETKEISRAADIYIACREGKSRYDMFDYTRKELEATSVPESLIPSALQDKTKIPESMREELNSYMTSEYLANYVEKNNYYRRLMGLPDYGTEGILIDPSWIPEGLVIKNIKYVHELPEDILIVMENNGTLESIMNQYPDAKYLDYLGSYSIDCYYARKADQFQLLYLPTIDYEILQSRYRILYEKNRLYTLRRVYSEAFRYGSEQHYDSFMKLYITISTIIDLINEVPNFIIQKEVFDSRCIRFLFESYGLPYYSEIPTKYQLKIIKNINTLIKYKSSRRNMIDICAIFGFDNIQVFKYYILRNRKLDIDGNYVFASREVEDPNDPTKTITEEDPTKEYELKFIKIPIDEYPDEYVKKIEDHIGYDMMTMSDYWWDGGDDHEVVKNIHLEQDFAYRRTKYISIDTVSNMTELAFTLPYFFNMLYDEYKLEDYLTLLVPFINNAHYFRFTDLFIYLFALNDLYNNIPDNIYTDTYLDYNKETGEYSIRKVAAKVGYDEDNDKYYISNMDELTNSTNVNVLAFNIRPNVEELNKWMADNYITMQDLGIYSFKMPVNAFATYDALLDVFETNKGVYNHLIDKMTNAETNKEYEIYKKVFDMLMIKVFKLDYFLLDDGTMPTTYTQYLKYRDSILYLSLSDILKIEDLETRRKEIDGLASNAIYAIEEFIDSDKYKLIFSNLPTVSADYIKKYVVKIIEIFKSYKIQLYDINNSYSFDDPLENLARPRDYTSDVLLSTTYKEHVDVIDNMVIDINTTIEEHVTIEERVTITPFYS